MKHICVVKLTIIGSDNGLSPGRRQVIIWTNAGILLIGPLETHVIDILIGIQTFPFKKMHLKMSSAKWRLFCLGLNLLNISISITWISHMAGTRELKLYYGSSLSVITLRPRQNGCQFADDVLKCIFFNEIFEFWLKFHWILFLRVQLAIFQHWFR